MKWKSIRLGEITRAFISGGTPDTKTSEFWTGPIPWITGADVVDGKAIPGRRFISKSAIHNSAANLVPKGSILVVTRTGVGKIAMAQEDIAISQDLTGIVLRDGFVPSFVMWAIRAQIGSLISVQRGATIKGVLREDVARLPIPFVGLSEQRRIVELLEQADGLRRQRIEADTLADRILPALFHKMFGDPAMNPKGWTRLPLGEITVIDALMVDPREPGYIDLPHVGPDRIESGTGRLLPGLTARQERLISGKYLFDARHVLYSKIRPYLRKVALPENRGLCSADMYPVTPIPERATREYIWALLLSTAFTNYTTEHSGRANIPKVNREQFANYLCPLPPLALQQAFSRHVARLRFVGSERNEARQKIDALFVTMLHRAFTGELSAKWREAHLKELLAELEQQARLLKPPLEE